MSSDAVSSRVVRSRRFRLVARTSGVDDRFFREMVSSMRNGVLAVTTDGSLAVLNTEAYRIFGMVPDETDIGRPYADVLRIAPRHRPGDRGRLRAQSPPEPGRDASEVDGPRDWYTLSHVRAADGTRSGIALFFKDLTRVEQLEERERLRDRLAALGEMAAAIAHELKNPLAGIEVMAGLLRRKVPESPDAQSILTDIINEAKMANATVVEVLDYVRPVRLETERTSIADVMHAALAIAEGKAPRGGVQVHTRIASDLPSVHGDRHQLCQVFTNLLINAFEALGGSGSIWMSAEQSAVEGDHTQPDSPAQVATVVVQVSDDGPGCRRRWWTGCSTRSSRPRRRVRASGWRSSARLWTHMTAASTSARWPGSAHGSR